jgi:hypothetical protein
MHPEIAGDLLQGHTSTTIVDHPDNIIAKTPGIRP